jgi:Tfp pilus assembly protein PilF
MLRPRPGLPLAAALAALLACAGPNAKQRRGAEIHHDLAVDALRGGRAQEALREYDEAIRLDPKFALALRADYPEAHNNLGQLLAKTGRPEQALTEFDAALADLMYREPYVARCNRGVTLWRMGRKEEGVTELRNCVTQAPRYCDGRRELGRVLLAEGRAREAIDQLTVYADTCKRADAHLQLGQARMKAGDVAGARAAFERCRELGAGAPEAEECQRSLSLLQ